MVAAASMVRLDVSILVFLDTSVPGIAYRPGAAKLARFNPCFSGYLCSGAALARPENVKLLVSILVFLDTSVPG